MKELKDIDEGTIRRIDWQELIPPVLLFRVFSVSIGGRALFFALVGIFLTIAINLFFYQFNSLDERRFVDITEKSIHRERGFSEIIDRMNIRNDNFRGVFNRSEFQIEQDGTATRTSYLFNDWRFVDLIETIDLELHDSVLFVWKFFTFTGGKFFIIEHGSWSKFFLRLIEFFAVVIVWSFAGGLICRIVAMRLTRDGSESVVELFRFLRYRGFGYLSSVLILTVGIWVCFFLGSIPAYISGRVDVGVVNYLSPIFFPISFLFNFLGLVLLVGLWFGFPLLFAAVSAEGADGFDSVSRMFSYLFQRPFHYFSYWFFLMFQGFLGYLVVIFFVTGTIMLTEHFVGARGLSLFYSYELESLEMSSRKVMMFCDSYDHTDIAGFRGVGRLFKLTLLSAWFDLLRFLVVAYIFAWFWSSGVAIYLLLRRSVDAAPFNEVYHQEPVKTRVLPEIKTE
ncbi:MAG: hypothetical protein LBB88_00760 [Planctomycetaceae bacterium]|jgi:hypothetical protein|nr:hypothetical protein [Planctomycetaceae bacterium]